MTSWTISQTTRFKAARMGAGLTNLESMYGTTDIPGYIGAFFDGPPGKATLELYRARSAMTCIDKMKRKYEWITKYTIGSAAAFQP